MGKRDAGLKRGTTSQTLGAVQTLCSSRRPDPGGACRGRGRGRGPGAGGAWRAAGLAPALRQPDQGRQARRGWRGGGEQAAAGAGGAGRGRGGAESDGAAAEQAVAAQRVLRHHRSPHAHILLDMGRQVRLGAHITLPESQTTFQFKIWTFPILG